MRRKIQIEQNKTDRRTYVCKRARLCSYLVDKGHMPYRIKPDRDNPKYNVYLFTATPELYSAVIEYMARNEGKNHESEG